MRFKFVHNTSDKVEYFGPRTYFKLEVKQKTEAVLRLSQEDPSERGVSETRPSVDLGMVLMRTDDNKSLHLVKFVEPRTQRDLFLETTLSPGEYYLVPKSVGSGFRSRRPLIKAEDPFTSTSEVKSSKLVKTKTTLSTSSFSFTEFKKTSTSTGHACIKSEPVMSVETFLKTKTDLVVSIFEDFFRKMDLENKRYITQAKFAANRKHFLQLDTEMPFERVIEKFEPKQVSGAPPKALSMKGFTRFCMDTACRARTVEEIYSFLDNLGYAEDLVSRKSRLVVLTVYSTRTVQVRSRDAIKGKDLC